MTINNIHSTALEVHLPTIGHGDRILARDISFEIARGEVILLAGANGTGKTTLLKALASRGAGPRNLRSQSDLRPSHGKPWAPPSDVPRVAQFRGPVPPETTVVMVPTNIPKVKGFTVEGFVRTGCYAESDWRGRIPDEVGKRLDGALELLGLQALKGRDISTLSDGEFQKACLAVGLTRQAELLLLDEPTAFLDVENRIDVLRTLKKAARNTGTAILFSSHDLHDELQVADRVFALTRDGRFLASEPGNRESILAEAFPGIR